MTNSKSELQRGIDWQLSRCRYFNGIQNKQCRARVDYHVLLGNATGCFAHMPCTRDPEPSAPCLKFELYSLEEATEIAKKREAHTRKFVLALNTAHADAKAKGLKRGHGGIGEVKCPNCDGGMIRYSVASVNGHMHGACTTKRCCSWME